MAVSRFITLPRLSRLFDILATDTSLLDGIDCRPRYCLAAVPCWSWSSARDLRSSRQGVPRVDLLPAQLRWCCAAALDLRWCTARRMDTRAALSSLGSQRPERLQALPRRRGWSTRAVGLGQPSPLRTRGRGVDAHRMHWEVATVVHAVAGYPLAFFYPTMSHGNASLLWVRRAQRRRRWWGMGLVRGACSGRTLSPELPQGSCLG